MARWMEARLMPIHREAYAVAVRLFPTTQRFGDAAWCDIARAFPRSDTPTYADFVAAVVVGAVSVP